MDPSGSTPTLRRARPDDAASLETLEQGSFVGDRMSGRSLRRMAQATTADLFVLEFEGGLVGYALALHRSTSRAARLYSIAVDPRMRGRGYSKLLLNAVEGAARERNSERLTLEVRRDNVSARELYARFGYHEFGLKPSYYEDGEDAVRMQKDLRATPKGMAA